MPECGAPEQRDNNTAYPLAIDSAGRERGKTHPLSFPENRTQDNLPIRLHERKIRGYYYCMALPPLVGLAADNARRF